MKHAVDLRKLMFALVAVTLTVRSTSCGVKKSNILCMRHRDILNRRRLPGSWLWVSPLLLHIQTTSVGES